jgi:hypothetical protein
MVLLLNYLHWFILILGVILTYLNASKSPKEKVNKRFFVILATTLVITWAVIVLAASYGYKGSVPRIAAPVYEVKEDGPVIQDRLLNTKKPEEKAQDDFDKMVDWRNSKAEESSSDTTTKPSDKE